MLWIWLKSYISITIETKENCSNLWVPLIPTPTRNRKHFVRFKILKSLVKVFRTWNSCWICSWWSAFVSTAPLNSSYFQYNWKHFPCFPRSTHITLTHRYYLHEKCFYIKYKSLEWVHVHEALQNLTLFYWI